MGWKVMFGEVRTKTDGVEDDGTPRTIRYSDTEVDFDDLPPDVFGAIAKEVDVGLTYWGVYTFPKESPEIVYRIVCAAAKVADEVVPDKPTTMRQQKVLDGMLERTVDIGERPMENGFPSVPGGTESGSSSGPSGASTGSQAKSDENESVTS